MTYLANQVIGPRPKSLPRQQRNFDPVPLLLREKGLGDEGLRNWASKVCKCTDQTGAGGISTLYTASRKCVASLCSQPSANVSYPKTHLPTAICHQRIDPRFLKSPFLPPKYLKEKPGICSGQKLHHPLTNSEFRIQNSKLSITPSPHPCHLSPHPCHLPPSHVLP